MNWIREECDLMQTKSLRRGLDDGLGYGIDVRGIVQDIIEKTKGSESYIALEEQDGVIKS